MKKFAVTEENTKGRIYHEKHHSYRDDFDRDRDRVIHSGSFRRLEGKTQVFTPGINDHYRTRLTHSIEVAQIGRTIAKCLGVNEALTEAICLAHDLGHSPFGHSGESALSDIMAPYGGFEHNKQTLRIVEMIEDPYPDFAGLNLLYETRLGLARHESTYDKTEDARFSEPVCSIEGQIASVADRIAYNCHDFEDGLRSFSDSKINIPQLWSLDIVKEAWDAVGADKIETSYIRNIRVAKTIINHLVADVIETSKANIKAANVKTLNDVYCCENVVALSNQKDKSLRYLEKFLEEKMYNCKELSETSLKVRLWLGRIMEYYINEPDKLPRYYREMIECNGLERSVCDYVSGMTDRFAIKILNDIEKCG
ncbi:MAG: dGTP triphosphohydrolase [Sedimentisphaeraceae bacterium JB056]